MESMKFETIERMSMVENVEFMKVETVEHMRLRDLRSSSG